MFVGKITFKEIKAAYYYGGRIKLNESWHAENTVCANSKLYFVLDGEIEVDAYSRGNKTQLQTYES